MQNTTFIYRNIFFAIVFQVASIGFITAQATLVIDTFFYSGSSQTLVLPNCVNTITVQANGAAGGWGSGSNAWAPGLGGYVDGILNINSGTILYLNIGAAGTGSAGGFNGGGDGGQGTNQFGGGGGGATDIRLGGNTPADRILVAGGGGGGGSYLNGFGGGGGNFMYAACGNNGIGGEGGWSNTNSGPAISGSCNGGNGSLSNGGGAGGGINSAGTVSGSGSISAFGQSGSLAHGGNGAGDTAFYGGNSGGVYGAGGGGAGYYGGAGGMSTNVLALYPESGGGGGGSSFADSLLFSSVTFSGTGLGDGYIVLRYYASLPVITVVSNSYSVCIGASVSLSAGGVSSYTWLPVNSFTGSTLATISISPIVSSNYTVLGTNSSGCVSQKIIAVHVNSVSSIQINASPSNTICSGEPLILTAGSTTNWLWTNSVNTNTFNTPSLFISPGLTTTYSVSGNDQNACKSLGSIQVVVLNCTNIVESDELKLDLFIFPNPAEGEFTLQSMNDMKVTLINQLGECVFSIILSDLNERKISFSNFEEGLYFVCAETETSRIVKKLVVSK